MYFSGGCQRSSVAHWADNRYFNNDPAVGKQGARGNISFFLRYVEHITIGRITDFRIRLIMLIKFFSQSNFRGF